jgi:hypothetical protein
MLFCQKKIQILIFFAAPSIFSVAFSIVRPFLHENTVKKIQIFSSNSRKWKAALLENISPDQLPTHFGGTQMGPDGDTKCTHKVRNFGLEMSQGNGTKLRCQILFF